MPAATEPVAAPTAAGGSAVLGAGGTKRCFRSAGQIFYGDVLEGQAQQSQEGAEQQSGDIERHGQGCQILTAQTVTSENVILGRYEGGWKHGKMTGFGIYRWSDGSVYEGGFVDGKPHGHGRRTWPEGSVYDGAWDRGEMTGQGRFDNAFDGIAVQGVFFRNCFHKHDGTWLDVHKQREEYRVASLCIGAAGPPHEIQLNVVMCAPSELGGCISGALRSNLVPLILCDSSCPEAADPASASTSQPASRAPLWCLEQGERGSDCSTTVHLAYAAVEKRRRRDFAQIFRSAIQQSLLTYRPFALVFGEGGGINPQDLDDDALAEAWKLTDFFDQFSLPPDLFDLKHWHGSGAVEFFLPPEKRGSPCARVVPNGADASAEGVDAGDGGEADEAGDAVAEMLAPPVAYLLRFVLVSLRRLAPGLDVDGIRAHVRRRFAEHVPLHRCSVIVVSAP